MKKSIFILLNILLVVSLSFSQSDIEGKWEGKILLPGMEFDIVTDFTKSDTGYTGLIDIIQQSAIDLPLQNIVFLHPEIQFELATPAATAYFSGSLVTTDSISGEFKQAGFSSVFYLIRYRGKVETEVEENLPYTSEEISFNNADNYFAGTLTLPDYKGRHPAVILITGSGAQDRDENIFGFKIFKIIADHFTRNGFAVLRYDDRNTGKSKGTPVDSSTTEDFAEDVSCAVDFLKTRNDINPLNIGLLGHSEGGIVAPIVAAKRNDIAFIVLMAGTAVPGKDVIIEQTKKIKQTSGDSDEEINSTLELLNDAIKCNETDSGWEELETKLKNTIEKGYNELSDEEKSKIDNKEEFINTNAKGFIHSFNSPWMKYFLFFNPQTIIEKVNSPVLALFGGLDLQVLESQNLEPMRNALSGTGKIDYIIKTFEKANHLFQEAETGNPSEYSSLKKEFIPGFLEYITEWMLKYVSPSR
ncbi:MAG: alpha/beta hydrolase [Ignavibacteria bacterium]|nr:alpha/beta hydrolase [Ignavibacteria bacterium]